MTIPVHSASRRRALRRNLKTSNADGFAFSVMVGIGETYLPAFMLARGFGELNAALIATVPVLLGSIVQLLAPALLRVMGSPRKFVVATAAIQALSMVMLCLLAVTSSFPAWVVFIPATLYWAGGLSTGPAWNVWIQQLIPASIRSGFFARRSRLCHVGVLLGLISGGLLLRWSASNATTIPVFCILFGVGAIGRFLSAAMLARQTETRGRATGQAVGRLNGQSQPLAKDIKRRDGTIFKPFRRPGPAARLVLFLMAMQTAVHVSGPYFNPFMLKELGLSWVDYMSLLSLGFVGKMLSLPWAGRVANRFGADRLLWIGAAGIMPMSGLWFISQDFLFLAAVQILSGLVWGCYELAMLLMFFGKIPTERRVTVLTLYNFGNSAAMVCGTLIGAAILHSLGSNSAAYLSVFVASAVLRLVALLALPGRRKAIRVAQLATVTRFRSRIVAAKSMSTTVRSTVSVVRSAAMSVTSAGEVSVEPMSSVIVLAAESAEQSSVTRRMLEGGSGGTRRRDSSSPATRRPARTAEPTTDLAPRE